MAVAAVDDPESVKDDELHPDEAAVLGGKSIEDRAKEGEAEEEEDDGTPQLVLPGTGPKLSTQVGGKKPTESYFKMSGVSLPIAGGVQMEKDSEVWVAVRVAIDDVHLRNKRKDDTIVSTKRVHTGTVLGQPIILNGPPEEVDV